MNKKIIHLIANSHIDPVWLWDKYEGMDEVLNTFKAACDRLDEYPDLRFTMSPICFLKWTAEYAPQVMERIMRQVAAERWEIVGGWWIEPDCNLPTSVSFYKQHEISRRYLDQYFENLEVPVAYNVDSFGHTASLPYILAECGFKYYVFCRPSEIEKTDLPGNLFFWEHAGKRVLCYRVKYHYSPGRTLEAIKSSFAKAVQDPELEDGDFCYFFGVGNHGGGPTKTEIEYLREQQGRHAGIRIHFSTVLDFFKAAEKRSDIPVYKGDLHYHAVGCYSVNRELKRAIRESEHGLAYTQRLMETLGGDTAELDPLWEKTLFNQFHDIMPGSCSPDAYEQALAEMKSAQNDYRDIGYHILKKQTARTPVHCPTGEFRIYNSLPYPVTAPFELESFLYFRPDSPFKNDAGVVPIQEISPSVDCVNQRWLFIDTIPAQTEKCYWFDEVDAQADHSYIGSTIRNYFQGDRIELNSWKVVAPGHIYYKGKALLNGQMTLESIFDLSDTWSHRVKWYGRSNTFFEPKASAVASGPLARTLTTRYEYNNSDADILVRVYRDLPYLDLDIRVRWQEKCSLLKLCFPFAAIHEVKVQGPGATIDKNTNEQEEPLHGWLRTETLEILQDGLFAYDRVDDHIRLTLVRSNIFGYHNSESRHPFDAIPHLDFPYHYTDMGSHYFKIRLYPHQGETSEEIDKRFSTFIEPLKVIRNNL